MNHREPTQVPTGTRQAMHCLVLMLTTFTPATVLATVRSRPIPTEPEAYLPTVGAPALRFADVPPPPDLTTRPAAAAPPQPAMTREEAAVASANAAAAHPVSSAAGNPANAAATTDATAKTPAAQPAATPAPILPDDLRPQVRAEDFLPFFQAPGTTGQPGEVTVVMPVPHAPPAPGTLPASSATYTQSPK